MGVAVCERGGRMNKQEVIEKIKKEKSPFNSWEDLNRNNALDIALDIVEKLDEETKPLVPKFVADWYEENKDNFEFNLYQLSFDYYNCYLDIKMMTWFHDKYNKPIETLVKMKLFGYEVEKEKLYKVSLKKNGLGIGIQQQDGSFKEKFTKTELSEYCFNDLGVYEVEEVEE